MVTVDDLMAFLNDFMADVEDKDPYMPNRLHVRGREEVKVLATGVSATLRLFEEAVARDGDANELVSFWIYRADDSTQGAPTIERRIPVFLLGRGIGGYGTAEVVARSLPVRDRSAAAAGAPRAPCGAS